jgi:hypothetical protein
MPPPTVTVVVGTGQETHEFEIKQAHLLRQSALFRKAWANRGDGEVALVLLPGIEVDHFRVYHHWVSGCPHTPRLDHTELEYTIDGRSQVPNFAVRRFSKPAKPLARSEEEDIKTESSILADSLVHLWALGRLLGDVDLQKTTMAELTKWYVDAPVQSVITEQTIAFVHLVTMYDSKSPLRQLCVRWARCKVKDKAKFSRVAPLWLSGALLCSQTEKERRADAEESAKTTREANARKAREAKSRRAKARRARKKATASVSHEDDA